MNKKVSLSQLGGDRNVEQIGRRFVGVYILKFKSIAYNDSTPLSTLECQQFQCSLACRVERILCPILQCPPNRPELTTDHVRNVVCIQHFSLLETKLIQSIYDQSISNCTMSCATVWEGLSSAVEFRVKTHPIRRSARGLRAGAVIWVRFEAVIDFGTFPRACKSVASDLPQPLCMKLSQMMLTMSSGVT